MTASTDNPPLPDRVLASPRLSLREGAPFDDRFDDIYFMPGHGIAEGETVFLAGNGLPQRWRTSPSTGGGRPFRLFELGFGTGLNFLLTAARFLEDAPARARLDYWAVEAFPLTPEQRRAVRTDLPARLKRLADRLDRLWPTSTRGIHPLPFHPRIRLVAIWDDGAKALADLPRLRARTDGFDAWYADGFAPARAPDLWQPALFAAAAAYSAPGATLATFSAARPVRDALQGAGFAVRRVAGFAGKRHRTVARLPAPPLHLRPRPDAIVIGAGIAGICAARSLAAEGATVALVDGTGPAAGASGNPLGLVTPRLGLEDTPADRFFRSSWTRMLATVADAPRDAVPHRGALLPARDGKSAERAARLVREGALPPDDFRYCDRGTAMEAAGVDVGGAALAVPAAPTIRPGRLCRWMADGLTILRTEVGRLDRRGEAWVALSRRGNPIIEAEVAILAGGAASLSLFPDAMLPIVGRRGQITLVAATPPSLGLKLAISGDGYVTPAIDGVHALGATFDPAPPGGRSLTDRPTARDDGRNRRQLADALPALAARLGGSAMKIVGHRRSVRATTPDRLPLIGPVPDASAFTRTHRRAAGGAGAADWDDPDGLYPGLFTLSGLGARGFLTAFLAGEILAARIVGGPIPADRSTVAAVHPARFLWRDLKRGRVER